MPDRKRSVTHPSETSGFDLRKPTVGEKTELWMSYVMRHLPLKWTSAIGGHLGARFGRRGIAKAEDWTARIHTNLERIGGIADAAERERLIVEHTRRIGEIYAEFTILHRMAPEGRLEIIGQEHLASSSRPIIMFSGHMGNWELIGHLLQLTGRPASVLYSPPDNPVRHYLAVKARLGWQRERGNLELVPATPHAIRLLDSALANGRNLLMYVDEERDGQIWAPGLGRHIPYSGNRWLTARLAARHGVDLVPAHVEYKGNTEYRIIIHPKLVTEDHDEQARARSLADQMSQYLETWIRARPEHWYWLGWLDLDKPFQGPPMMTGR